MKKFALTVLLLALWAITPVHAADFSCQSGDVTCLIAAINEANAMPGEHTINLEPGSYTLQRIDNGMNGLPVISGSIKIQATTEELPTVIERDPNAPAFRFFEVLVGGKLTLAGVTIQGGLTSSGGAAILNRGVTSLEDSIVRRSNTGGNGAILNSFGTLRVIRSIISDNRGGIVGGGIDNAGDAFVENSTIARNVSADGGGIFNFGSLVVKNSAIIFNSTDSVQPGGGIHNAGGSVEIFNTTIANNRAGVFGGSGIFNRSGGRISITNSTIRENGRFTVLTSIQIGAAGIVNDEGSVQIQNTIIAGNIQQPVVIPPPPPDCSGTITSLGNNLVGDPIGCDINLQPSDLTGDPGLDSFVEEDLPGRAFYPVLAGSPVIERGNPSACLQSDQLGNLRVGICDIGAIEFQGKMLVSVGVRPRSDANRINPNSTKEINVAILSTDGFDATEVDSNTVRFGATGTEAVPIHVARRDVDGDGDRDMIVRFEIQDTGIKCGNTSATLTGQIPGGASIIGSSPIRTVQCGR
jgi:hypothetical protein